MALPLPSRSGWPALMSALAAACVALVACTPMPTVQAPAAATTTTAVAVATAQTAAQQPQRAENEQLPVPAGLVALTQPAGQERLLHAVARQSFWPLSAQFETQKNQAYCSVATSVMVLNALNIPRPSSSLYPDFPYFTQDDFFRSVDPRVATAAQVAGNGMTLDQLGAVLGQFPVTVQKIHASDLTVDQFRDTIRSVVGQDGRFVLLNFKRSTVGEVGGGHWSPIAAYDAASDSALVLDVARYKYPPVWVPVTKLYQGAVAVDSDSGLSRGLLIVGKQ
jgi:hypothetical protein